MGSKKLKDSEEKNLDEDPNVNNKQPVEKVNENSSKPNIETSQTENMEVHKHPHHVTHKKKWGEYLL